MKKKVLLIHFLLFVLILSKSVFAAVVDLSPPFDATFIPYATTTGVFIKGVAGFNNSGNTDTGQIVQSSIASTAGFGGAGVRVYDAMTGRFPISVPGEYTIEFSGHISWRLYSVGETLIAGYQKGVYEIKMKAGLQGGPIVTGKVKYATDLSPKSYIDNTVSAVISNGLNLAENYATGGLKTGIKIAWAIQKLQDVQPLKPVGDNIPFKISVPVSLDAAGTYPWWFELRSDTIAGAVGISGMFAASIVNCSLESIKITPGANIHKITSSAGANGTISPEGNNYVEQGGTIVFNASPNTGYEVDQWKKNDSPIQNGENTYSLSNVQEDANIVVTFKSKTPLGSETVTLTGSADTTLSDSNPTSNYGNMAIIGVQSDNTNLYGLVKFNLGSIPHGSEVHDVELKLYCSYAAGTPQQIYIINSGSSWSESAVTWNTKPTFGSGYHFFYSVSDIGYQNIKNSELTDFVRDWANGTVNNYGIYIVGGNIGDSFSFASSEDSNSSKRPKLIVNYTKPDPPDLIITDLHPDPRPLYDQFTVGQNIDWHVTVKNNGAGQADSSSVGYYLGTSPTDYSNRIATGSIRALNKGYSGSNYGSISFNKGDIGQRFLICKADYHNTIKESSENNNTRVYGPFNVELPKVATPVISPGGGTFTGSAQVKLSCSTSGATIRYTTDGTTPTSTSAKYTEVLTVSHSSTIKARGFENGYTDSNVASANFTISQVLGAVSVDVTPNTASWTIAGPSNFEGNGRIYTGNHTFTNAPLGSYAWAGQDIAGYNNPSAETLSLAPGGTVAFNKIWTLPQSHAALNVALKANGGTATAGSVGTYLGTSHPASYADDGNEATAWCNLGLMPDWLKIKFDHVYLIKEVGVVWGVGSHNQIYSISLSEDGKNWQVVVPSRASATDAGNNGGYHGNTAISRERFPIVPTLARFIRINVTNTSAPATHIFKAIVSELQAFSKKTVLTAGWKHLRYDLSGSACTLEHTTATTKKDLAPLFNITGVGPNVLTGDVDGDGIVDIVTTAGNELRIYRGNGTLKQSIPLSRKCFVTVLQDFDGDGVLDIGLGSSGPGFAAYIYKGDGTLLKTFKGQHAGGSDVSISLLGMSKGKVLMSYDAGYAQTPRGFASFDYATSVEDWYYQVGPAGGENSVADIDGNGLLDITRTSSTVNNGASGNGTTDSDMYLVVVDETGHMKISRKYPSPSSGSVSHLFVDFKGSGSWGILGFEGHDPTNYPGRARIHLYSNSGSNEHIFDGPDNNSWAYAVGDLDGDGIKEVVASTDQTDTTTYVLNATLSKIRGKKIPGQVKLLCDLTGNGNLDIVLLSNSGQLRVLDKNLNEIATAQVGNRNGMVIASDINGDGRVDLLCLTNKLYVLSFEASKILGDVNGDGIVNLADATLAMRVTAGFNDAAVNLNADVNGDGKIGIEEVIYILKNIAGVK